MSSNTAIRIAEQKDGTWEAVLYDVDDPVFNAGGAWIGIESLDAALDIVKSWSSEYGLEIVRLKDRARHK